MKAYKGFNSDMTCRGFQYEVGKEYEIDGEIECCERGFHACVYPIDCFDFYSPEKVFCEVEQYGEIDRNSSIGGSALNTKVCSSKIKIGKKVPVSQMITDSYLYMLREHPDKIKNDLNSNGNQCHVIVSTDKWSTNNNLSGWDSINVATGCHSVNYAKHSCTVNASVSRSSVNITQGDRSINSATGVGSANSSASRHSINATAGRCSVNISAGERAINCAVGDESLNYSEGRGTVNVSTGEFCSNVSAGKGSISIGWGKGNKCKGCKGSYLVLSEWGDWDGEKYPLLGAQMVVVDGKTIKEDTYYTLKNGKVVEAEDETD